MKKQNPVIPNNLVNYLIPHLKNKIQRISLNQELNSWLNSKIQGINTSNQDNDHFPPEAPESQSHIKKCLSIQKQFRLKFPIDNLLRNVPEQFYQTTVLYVMEKKLFWFFKPESESEEENLKIHKQLEISLNLKLKGLYKEFEYNTHSVKKDFQQKKVNSINEKSTMTATNYSLNKKIDFDFQYNLLLMFSVSLVSAFFQSFFTELLIENSFKAQIYIILNHAFLDFEVSANVFEIMRKKYTFEQKAKEFQSLNTSQMIDKSINSLKRKQSESSQLASQKDSFLENSLQIFSSRGKSSVNKIQNSSRVQISTSEIKQNLKNPISINRMSSIKLYHEGSQKTISKIPMFLKPSVQLSHSMSLANSKEKVLKVNSKKSLLRQPNYSRFNSFLRDARQFSIPQQNNTETDLHINEQQQFYSTLKKCLHVDSLPPIIKKRMNINQYQKLNELDDLQDIKREVRSLDVSSKKNHMKSNDLSLAMNTFISLSTKLPKKKRHQTHMQVVQNSLLNDEDQSGPQCQKQNQISQLIDQNQNQHLNQKDDFQFRRLPVKASNLKLPYQKSAYIYQFTDAFSTKDTTRSKKNIQTTKGVNDRLPAKKVEGRQRIERQQKQMERSLQEKKKKTPSEWENYLNLLKKRQNNQNIVTFINKEVKESDNKKTLPRKTYKRGKQSSEKTHFITTQDSLGVSSRSIKMSENNSPKYVRQSVIIKDSIQSLDSSHIDLARQEPYMRYRRAQENEIEVDQVSYEEDDREEMAKYSSLEGQVNVPKQMLSESEQKYNSFQLRKRFKEFESNCKMRDEKIQYSIFKLNKFKK